MKFNKANKDNKYSISRVSSYDIDGIRIRLSETVVKTVDNFFEGVKKFRLTYAMLVKYITLMIIIIGAREAIMLVYEIAKWSQGIPFEVVVNEVSRLLMYFAAIVAMYSEIIKSVKAYVLKRIE